MTPSFVQWGQQARRNNSELRGRALSDAYRQAVGRGPAESDFQEWTSTIQQRNPQQSYNPDVLRYQFEQKYGPLDQQNESYVGDLGTALKLGLAKRVPESVAGLIDIPVAAVTGQNYAGQAVDWAQEKLGANLGGDQWAKRQEAMYTPETQQQLAENQAAWRDQGLGGYAKTLLSNPRALGLMAVESLPEMAAGGLVAKGLKVAPLLANRGILRAGIGEGAVMGGAQMENLTNQEVDPREAAGYAALTGVGGGALGVAGGRVAQRLGLIDPETWMAGVARGKRRLSYPQQLVGGAIVEGGLEELPQSMLEQWTANLATDRPWNQDLGKAGVTGAAVGSLMGAGFNVVPRLEPHSLLDDQPQTDANTSQAGPSPALDQYIQTRLPDPNAGLGQTSEQPYEPRSILQDRLEQRQQSWRRQELERQKQRLEARRQVSPETVANHLADNWLQAQDRETRDRAIKWKEGKEGEAPTPELSQGLRRSLRDILAGKIARANKNGEPRGPEVQALFDYLEQIGAIEPSQIETNQQQEVSPNAIVEPSETVAAAPETAPGIPAEQASTAAAQTEDPGAEQATAPLFSEADRTKSGVLTVSAARRYANAENPDIIRQVLAEIDDGETRASVVKVRDTLLARLEAQEPTATEDWAAALEESRQAEREAAQLSAVDQETPAGEQQAQSPITDEAQPLFTDQDRTKAGALKVGSLQRYANEENPDTIRQVLAEIDDGDARASVGKIRDKLLARLEHPSQPEVSASPVVEEVAQEQPQTLDQIYQERERLGQEIVSFLANTPEFKRAPKQLEAILSTTAETRNKEQAEDAGTSRANISQQANKAKAKLGKILGSESRAQLDSFLERSRQLDALVHAQQEDAPETAAIGTEGFVGDDVEAMMGQDWNTAEGGSTAETEASQGAFSFTSGSLAGQVGPERRAANKKVITTLARSLGAPLDWTRKNERAVRNQARQAFSDPERSAEQRARWEELHRRLDEEIGIQGAGENKASNVDAEKLLRRAAPLIDAEERLAKKQDQQSKQALAAVRGKLRELQAQYAQGLRDTVGRTANKDNATKSIPTLRAEIAKQRRLLAREGKTPTAVEALKATSQTEEQAQYARDLKAWEIEEAEARRIEADSQFTPETEALLARLWPILDKSGRIPWGGLSKTERAYLGQRLSSIEAQDETVPILKNAYARFTESRQPDKPHRPRPETRAATRSPAAQGDGRPNTETNAEPAPEPAQAPAEAQPAEKPPEVTTRLTGRADPRVAAIMRRDGVSRGEAFKRAKQEQEARFGQANRAASPTTKQKLGQVIRAVIGKNAHWRIHIYENMEDVPPEALVGIDDAGQYAWVMPDSRGVMHANFLTSRIEQGTELGKFLHEVGAHIGMKSLLPKPLYDNLYTTISAWVIQARRSDRPTNEQLIALKAWGRMSDATQGMSVEAKQDELIAYFIEEAVKHGYDPTATQAKGKLGQLLRQIWMAFKRALRRLRVDNIDSLTAQEIVNLAYGAARLDLLEGTAQQDGEARFGIPETIEQNISRLPEPIRDAVGDVVHTIGSRIKAGHYGLAFTHELINIAKSKYEDFKAHAERFSKAFEGAKVSRQRLEKSVSEIQLHYEALSKDEQNAVAEYWIDARLAGADGWAEKPDWLKAQITPSQAFAERLHRLSPEAQAVVWGAVKRMHDNLHSKRTLIAKQIDEYYDGLIGRADDDKAVASLEEARENAKKTLPHFKATQGPYMPFKRHGSHVVVARSAALAAEMAKGEQMDKKRVKALKRDPSHYHMEFVDGEVSARQLVRALEASGLNADYWQKAAWKDQPLVGYPELAKLKGTVQAMPEGRTKEEKSTRRALIDAVDQLALDILSADHALQSNRQAEGIAGFSRNMMQSFVIQGRTDAHYIANLEHLHQAHEAMAGLTRAAEKSHDNKKNRVQLANSLYWHWDQSLTHMPQPVIDRLAGLSSTWHLIFSPAYLLQNMTQTFMMGIPWMTQSHSAGKVYSKTMQAYKDLAPMVRAAINFRPFDLEKIHYRSEREREAIQALEDSGHLNIFMDLELGQLAGANNGRLSRAGRFLDTTLRRLPVKVEMLNRLSNGLAAYRLEMSKHGHHDQAVEYARQAILNAHGDYDGFHTPKLISPKLFGPLKVIAQFRKFQLIQIGYMAKLLNRAFADTDPEVRKGAQAALAYTIGHTTLLGGALGFPAMGLIQSIASLVGDDDDPFDKDVQEYKLRKWLDKQGFEPGFADVLLRGVPAALGVNLTDKIGMQNMLSLMPFQKVDPTEYGNFEKVIVAALGPSTSALKSIYSGVGKMQQGDLYGGLEKGLPSGLGDAMRAWRIKTGGDASYNGDQVISPEEFHMAAAFYASLGFTPKILEQRWSRQRLLKTYEAAYQGRTAELKKDYAKALDRGDRKKLAQLRQQWQALQRKKQQAGFSPSPVSDLIKSPSAKAKRERQVSAAIKYDSGNRRFVQETGRLYGG